MPNFGTKDEKRRVVIIDDSELVLEQTRAVLTAAGYEVVTTSQTVGASRLLASADLVIVDLHMPGFDGRNLIESMRRAIEVSVPPASTPEDEQRVRATKRRCLMYLYTSDEEAASAYREMGFDGCFSDKGDTQALLEQVDAVFRLLQMRGIANRIRGALDR
jgi:DNA-binding NarL/FixJ family response regulator